MMIAIKILKAIDTCFYVYMLMIVARCLLTWIPNINWENPFFNALKSSVDIYLDLFRKIIPPVAMFDFSPIVACIVLMFLNWAIINVGIIIINSLGIIG